MKHLALLVLLAACPHPPGPPKHFDALAPGDHVSDGTAYHVLGDGPVCVAISGGPGLDWKYLRSPELEKRVQLVYVEPIGSGASQRLPAGQTYTLARYVDQLERLRVVLRMDKLCLIGHSHGGTIAARYAIDHPDRVSALVLYSAPDRVDKEFAAAGAKNLERWKDEVWYADARAAFDATPKTDAEATALWPRAMKFLFADYTAHADEYARAIVPVTAAPDLAGDKTPVVLRPELGAIAAPTLVITAAMDWCCGEPYSAELAAGIKGAVVEKFVHSGHMSAPSRSPITSRRRSATSSPVVSNLPRQRRDRRLLLLQHLLERALRHLLAQPRGAIARGPADRGERDHARHGHGDLRGGLDDDHAIGGLAERALGGDDQAIEDRLGIGEHDLLAVAPREAARDRVVQRQIEARHGLAADGERAEQRVEDLRARRLAIAVLHGIEHLVAEDVDGGGEIDFGHGYHSVLPRDPHGRLWSALVAKRFSRSARLRSV